MFYEDSSFQEIAVLTENESMLFLESPNRVQPPYASVCFVEQNQCGRPVTFAETGIDTPAHLCLSCRLIPCHLHRDQKGNQAGFSVDEMLTLLLNGMTVDQLLAIIQKRIAAIVSEATQESMGPPRILWGARLVGNPQSRACFQEKDGVPIVQNPLLADV
jgi:hypothetical protein